MKKLLQLFLLMSGLFIITACDSDAENAVEDVGDAIEDAADEAADEVKDATN